MLQGEMRHRLIIQWHTGVPDGNKSETVFVPFIYTTEKEEIKALLIEKVKKWFPDIEEKEVKLHHFQENEYSLEVVEIIKPQFYEDEATAFSYTDSFYITINLDPMLYTMGHHFKMEQVD